MTGGILEENLNSLHLEEGSDYYHFNWLLLPRKKECATLMNLVVKSCKWPPFLLVQLLKWYQWLLLPRSPEQVKDLSVKYEATVGRRLDVSKDISDQQNMESKHVWKQRTTLLVLSRGKILVRQQECLKKKQVDVLQIHISTWEKHCGNTKKWPQTSVNWATTS